MFMVHDESLGCRVKKSLLTPKFTNTKEILEKVLDVSAHNMTPFRVLYNLEVTRPSTNPSSGMAFWLFIQYRYLET
jgi:hypothetical protein